MTGFDQRAIVGYPNGSGFGEGPARRATEDGVRFLERHGKWRQVALMSAIIVGVMTKPPWQTSAWIMRSRT